MKRGLLAVAMLVVTSMAVGCQSKMGTCSGGSCGLLGGECGSCGMGAPIDPYAEGTSGGPLAGLHGHKNAGPQSHMGSMPGPADGPAAPTYGYPYYTTRGPRDFLNPNPPSIGR